MAKKPLGIGFIGSGFVTRFHLTAYQSAELERTVEFAPDELEGFLPAVSRAAWNPKT